MSIIIDMPCLLCYTFLDSVSLTKKEAEGLWKSGVFFCLPLPAAPGREGNEGEVGMEMKARKRSDIFRTAGIITGAAAVLTGIVFLVYSKESSLYREAYEALLLRLGSVSSAPEDLAEVYRAAAFAGLAVEAVYRRMTLCFGTLFILIGAVDVCVFAGRASRAAAESASGCQEDAGDLPEEWKRDAL